MTEKCEQCGGVIASPTRRVPLWLAVEHHDASCPARLRRRPDA